MKQTCKVYNFCLIFGWKKFKLKHVTTDTFHVQLYTNQRCTIIKYLHDMSVAQIRSNFPCKVCHTVTE
jgi:hypothetical protein